MVDSSPAGRRYAVFISYRHADNKEMGRKWANWLHEALESYEVPPDLVGSTSLRGDQVPPSLYPVFRDEEELPADADLSANIQRALEHSGLLVVICSPRAVKRNLKPGERDFVAEEIRYFKELGKSDRILALMIDGEPNASDDPAKQTAVRVEDECFPEPLRFGVAAEGNPTRIDWNARTEPIAADVRPGGRVEQGWTTAAAYEEHLRRQGGHSEAETKEAVRDYAVRLEQAKLKIIAGALGLSLGVLTKRDKAAQIARAKHRARILRRWLVVVGVLSVLAMSGGAYSLSKKAEAELRTAEVEMEKSKADQLLWTASRGDHEASVRAFREGRDQEGLAYLHRALNLQPKNLGALVSAVNRSVGLGAPLWRVRPDFHVGAASQFILSPDGKVAAVELAAPSESGGLGDGPRIRLVQLPSGGTLMECKGHSPLQEMAFSRDGRFLAVAGNRNGTIMDVGRRVVVGEIRSDYEMRHLAFSSDGSRLAVVGDTTFAPPGMPPGVLQVFAAPDWKPVFSKTFNAAQWLGFCSGDSSVVILNIDSRADPLAAPSNQPEVSKFSIHVFDASDGIEKQKVSFAGELPAASLSPDGVHLAVSGGEEAADGDKPSGNLIRIVNLETGKVEATHHTEGKVMETGLGETAMIFSDDGSKLAAVALNDLIIMDVLDPAARRANISIGTEGVISSIDFSPDTRQIAFAIEGSSVRVADTFMGATLIDIVLGKTAGRVQFSRDGQWLAVSSSLGEGEARLLEPGAPCWVEARAVHGEIKTLALSPDERLLAVGVSLMEKKADPNGVFRTNGQIHLFRMPDLVLVKTSELLKDGDVNDIAWSPDGGELAVASASISVPGELVFFKADSLAVRARHPSEKLRCRTASYSPDGRHVYVGSGTDMQLPGGKSGRLTLLVAQDVKALWSKETDIGIVSLRVSPDGGVLAAAGSLTSIVGGSLAVMSAADGSEVFRAPLVSIGSCARFSRDGRWLGACCGSNGAINAPGEVVICDWRERKITRRSSLGGSAGACLSFSPDARWIAITGSRGPEGEVSVLERSSGALASTKTFGTPPTAVAFAAGGSGIVTGGWGGVVQSWDGRWMTDINLEGGELWNARLPELGGLQFDSSGAIGPVSRSSSQQEAALVLEEYPEWLEKIDAWLASAPESRTVSPFAPQFVHEKAATVLMEAKVPVSKLGPFGEAGPSPPEPAFFDAAEWVGASAIDEVADAAPWHPLVPLSLARLQSGSEKHRFLASLTLERLRAANEQLYGRATLADYAAWAAAILHDELKLEPEAKEALAFAIERTPEHKRQKLLELKARLQR